MMRLSIGHSRRDVTLGDDTRVRRGEPIGELHLWNERVPPIPREGPDLAWARRFQRQLLHSFHALAVYVAGEPSLQGVQAFCGLNSFGSRYAPAHMARIVDRWGLDLVVVRPGTLWGHLRQLAENAHAVAMIWAYNPNGLRGLDPRALRRDELWISRRRLMDKYLTVSEDH